MRIDKINHNIYFLASLSLIGILTLLICTRGWGIGITSDSVVYIATARNLLNGNDLSIPFGNSEATPMTHYPPLFPVVLSMIGVLNIDPLNAARYLNAFLFGANILLVGIMINKCTNDSFWFPIFGSLLILISDVVLNIHSVAWSEPLFLLFGFLGLLILSTYIERPQLSFLIISSVAIALAFLTRYIGITLLITGMAGILILSRETYYKRIIDSIIFFTITSLPMGIWLIRNLYAASSATNRKIVFHPINYAHVKSAIFHISIWLSPETISPVQRAILLIIAILSVLLLIRKIKKQNINTIDDVKLPFLLFVFILFYAGFLIISISFLDARTSLDNRILLPIYVSAIILILYQGYKLFRHSNRLSFSKITLIIIYIIFMVSYILRGAIWIINSNKDGQGYASKNWKQSEIIHKMIALSPKAKVYTNGPDAVYILSGKLTCWIPAKFDSTSLQINDNYLSEMTRMQDQLKNKNGILVYFNTIKRGYLPSENELREQLPLKLITRGADGAIYEIEP